MSSNTSALVKTLCRKIHDTLGDGFKESVYKGAIVTELRNERIPFHRDYSVAIKYENETICVETIDFLIENVAIYIKHLKTSNPLHDASKHLSRVLKFAKIENGMTVNFGHEKGLTIMSLDVYDNTEHYPEVSPSDTPSLIIALCQKIQNILGTGFKEYGYKEALTIELMKRNITFRRDYLVTIKYKDNIICTETIDFVINYGDATVCAVCVRHLKTVASFNDTTKYFCKVIKYAKIKSGIAINFGNETGIATGIFEDGFQNKYDDKDSPKQEEWENL